MVHYLYDSPIGFHIFKTNKSKKPKLEEENNSEYYIIDEYLFKSNTEALETITQINNQELPSSLKEILSRLSSEVSVSDKTMKNIVENIHPNVTVNLETYKEIKHAFYSERNVDSQKISFISHKIISNKMTEDVNRQDLMVIHAIKIIEDLEKDINCHAMKLREWYGFHFPELSALIPDNKKYLEAIIVIGIKETLEDLTELKEIVSEDTANQIIEVSKISMGTEIQEEDFEKIVDDTKSTIQMIQYRSQLIEYLEERMQVIAPNLMNLVGSMMGARLISKRGSLSDLSKCSSSTIQILGAEKALFSALKNKKDTPKYGFIYHANLVSKSEGKIKGTVARMLASKLSLAAKVDCFSEDRSGDFGKAALEDLKTRIERLQDASAPKASKRKSVKVIK
ncbi:Nucleolar protein 58 [Cucumispora dikerogammari]|nr:Nucleolar protein 58 [Cucumispora dikerogammari]